ncbi:MAG: DUF1292 domain-containing protein [Clostridia bacterium]|nr:DUF1292 domain-containing protein [Clostridia bacterium]
MDNELFIENEIYTLTDEDGKESEFQLIGKAELDGETYVALFPLEDNEDGAYVILKMAEEEGESVFVSIEDDDEFEKAAAYFDEKLIPEIDYDESEEG